MEYFFFEATVQNIGAISILVLFLAFAGIYYYRFRKVKIQRKHKAYEKGLTLIASVVLVGFIIWLAVNFRQAGTAVVLGSLILVILYLALLTFGLTEDGIQFSGIRSLRLVYYKDIESVELEERSDFVRLKFDYPLLKLERWLDFPTHKKQEIITLLEKNNVKIKHSSK